MLFSKGPIDSGCEHGLTIFCSSFQSLQIFRTKTPPEALDLISHLLEYTPTKRFSPVEAMVHPFFDEIRKPDTKLSNGKDMPPLFNFTALGKKKQHGPSEQMYGEACVLGW